MNELLDLVLAVAPAGLVIGLLLAIPGRTRTAGFCIAGVSAVALGALLVLFAVVAAQVGS